MAASAKPMLRAFGLAPGAYFNLCVLALFAWSIRYCLRDVDLSTPAALKHAKPQREQSWVGALAKPMLCAFGLAPGAF